MLCRSISRWSLMRFIRRRTGRDSTPTATQIAVRLSNIPVSLLRSPHTRFPEEVGRFMCLGATKLHPRLDLKLGSREVEGSEKGAMVSLRALSYGVRVRPLSSELDLAWARVFIGGEMQWSR